MRVVIEAHVPDGDGVCVGCRECGDDETYPCAPVTYALRAADLLTQRLLADVDRDRADH